MFQFYNALFWLCYAFAVAMVAVGDGLKNPILMSQACALTRIDGLRDDILLSPPDLF